MLRRLVVACSVSVLVATTVGASAAAAQDRVQLDLSTAVSATVAPPLVLAIDQLPVGFESDYHRLGPSPVMASLYATTAIMQALDVHSTLGALSRGGVEKNPLVATATRNKAAFIALKAGVAFSTVMAARNMSKRNRVAAIVTLVAINSAYALVVNHNYRVARGSR